MSDNQHKNLPWSEYQERIATLEATVEHMDAICHTRADRISILEAQKSSIWNQYQYAEAGVKVLETLEAEYKRLVSDFEALGRNWAEALDIIRMTGVAPQFVEKHK